jgi:endonuclease/exonuclease/phosphatase family metal-dependent hydrolase
VYRPPAGDLDRALQELSKQLEFANKSDWACYVVGDFNLNWGGNSNQINKYKEIVSAHGFVNIISESTRIGIEIGSIIDHILVKAQFSTPKGGVDLFLSDHKAVWVNLDTKKWCANLRLCTNTTSQTKI